MFTKQSRDASSFSSLRHALWKLLPVAILISLSVWFGFRSGVIHWQDDLTGGGLDGLLLGVCLALLLALYFESLWALVRVESSAINTPSGLEQSRTRLKNLFQTIPDMVWLKDAKGIYLACNPAFERLYGREESEIIGKTDYDFVNDKLAGFFRDHDRAALIRGVPGMNEEWLTLAEDGKSYLFETIKIPVKTSEGELVGVMGIARDITRRYAAEQEAQFFRNLVEFSGDPIYVLDRTNNYRMRFANQAACRHFGATKEEILKWTIFDWNPDITSTDIDHIDAQLKAVGSMFFETRHRCAGGTIVPVEVSFNRLIDDDRELSVGFIRNVSERKRVEMSLHQSQEQLRKIIAHQDLIREDERKRFARDIHDELGQHLLALRIDVSLLPQMAGDNQKIATRVNDILKNLDGAVQNARAIINDLRPSVLDLGFFAAMEWLTKDFERNGDIACELSGSEEELHIEEKQATTLFRVLQQALTNIQQHAIATQVRISLKRQGDNVIMTVTDNGVVLPGKPHGNWDVFDLLGIQERIAMQGGEAKIESANGTLLRVTLPVRSGELVLVS